MRAALPALGGVMVVAGLVFTLQGLGELQGSPMSDVQFWAVAGPIIAGFGVALMIVGLKPRR